MRMRQFFCGLSSGREDRVLVIFSAVFNTLYRFLQSIAVEQSHHTVMHLVKKLSTMQM